VTDDNTLVVTFEAIGANWEQWILVTSDRHWDSVHSDRTMQKRHLDEAVERNALIIDLGDLFDAMQAGTIGVAPSQVSVPTPNVRLLHRVGRDGHKMVCTVRRQHPHAGYRQSRNSNHASQ